MVIRGEIMHVEIRRGLPACTILALVVIAPVALPQSAPYGAIHECKTKSGTVVYQDTPCDLRVSHDATLMNWNTTNGRPRSFTGQSVTLNFHDVELGKILLLISEVNNTSLSMYDTVEASVRGDFRYVNVPWDEALSDIAKRYGLNVRFQNGRMIVLTRDDALYDQLVTKFEKQYPQLDPSSPAFNQRVLDHVKQVMQAFQKRNPSATASEAVSYAVLTTLGH